MGVIGGLGIVVIGVTGFVAGCRGVGVPRGRAGEAVDDVVVRPGPMRLAARIYWVRAACCSGVAVPFATA